MGMAEYDVVLLASFAQVEEWRKRHAQERSRGLFAQTVTTFNAWMMDLWELHGDGRAVVDPLQRQTVMQAAFERLACEHAPDDLAAQGADGAVGMQVASMHAADGADAGRCAGNRNGEDGVVSLALSPGVMKLSARCARDAAGVPAFERAVDLACAGNVPTELSVREALLLKGVGAYRDMLQGAGLIELGHVVAYLARHEREVFARPLRVLVNTGAPCDWHMEHLFESCSNLSVDVQVAQGAVGRISHGVALRFGFPSGRYAQAALVAQHVRALLGGERREGAGTAPTVVVAAKDPLSLYKQMEPELAGAGVQVCVQAQVPFSSTDFGRQLLSLCRVLQDEEDAWSKADLADALLPPFSGMSRRQGLQADRGLRADRLVAREAALASLRIASDTFSQLEEIAQDPEADILLGVFEQIAFGAPGRSQAWRMEQLAAASAVRSCTAAARLVGAGMAPCVQALRDAAVVVSYECVAETPQDAGRVVVTTQAAAAQMGLGSCDCLVLCDLTSEDYPVADKDDAAATLFGKLGLAANESALSRARCTFAMLMKLSRGELLCVRPLNDWDGNPTYPAAMLQELIDSYRADPTADDDVDDVFGLPDALRAGLLERGEELLFANASAASAEAVQQRACEVPRRPIGQVAPDRMSAVAVERRADDGRAIGFSPSPSQVEAYLDCPHKWFAQSRVKLEDLDEGFGALERGSYAHAVLQEFYCAFQALGFAKVAPDNLDEARRVMRSIAESVAREQFDLEPGSGRYVPTSQMEQREREACAKALVGYLDFEARFLPGFHPAYLEYRIDPERGVQYAGHPFIGTVDRIDVDDRGNAVVIDYKGSVGYAHEIAGKSAQLPGKVQARMYARAVERALGLNVVGAFYVSYGEKHAAAGAFDSRSIEAAHLPNMKVERSCCAAEDPWGAIDVEDFASLTFATMLDRTEQLVAAAMQAMAAGKVDASPSSSDSCAYCPVTACPKRGA